MKHTVLLLSGLALPFSSAAQEPDPLPEESRIEVFQKYLVFASYLEGGDVTPRWMSDGDRFWYDASEGGATRYRQVDPATGEISDLFDADRIRQSIEALTGSRPAGSGLPFERSDFSSEGGDFVRFELEGRRLELDLATYQVREVEPSPEPASRPRRIPEFAGVTSYFFEIPSPDGRWFAGIEDGNIVLREAVTDSIVRLTDDGSDDRSWGESARELGLYWSPDSKKLVAGWLRSPIKDRWPLVHYPTAEEVARNGFSATVDWHPGPWFTVEPLTYDLYLFDIASGQRARIEFESTAGQYFPVVEWMPDGSGILAVRRTFQGKSLELVVVDPNDGSHRVLLHEALEEGNVYAPNEGIDWTFLADGRRFVLRSEQDGWQHLYLYDIEDGLIRRLTRGPNPIRSFAVREDAGYVYFAASGVEPDRPWDRHVGRVLLGGGGQEILTNEPGQHWYTASPSGRYFVETHASIDRPLHADLRSSDGSLIATLAQGSMSRAVEELGWSPPEEFVATASDGMTELHGTLFKPWDFDSEMNYPVIDYLWAVHGVGAVSLRTDFIGTAMHPAQALAQLGFIVISFDDRGTYWRGRDYRLSTYGRGEIDQPADHREVLQQLAATRRWMDLDRVGAIGHSTFGFRATRMMLLAPELFDVGVSSAGPDLARAAQDSYWHEISGSEEMPFRPNSELVENLQGRLLLISGTEDTQGPFYSTIPLIDALVRAGKPYDLLVIPGARHDMFFPGGRFSEYLWNAVARYFVEHLGGPVR
jgi:dipeptidyl aminopeptidase/acylaminoacyl peptidase